MSDNSKIECMDATCNTMRGWVRDIRAQCHRAKVAFFFGYPRNLVAKKTGDFV
jgi:protein gp37